MPVKAVSAFSDAHSLSSRALLGGSFIRRLRSMALERSKVDGERDAENGEEPASALGKSLDTDDAMPLANPYSAAAKPPVRLAAYPLRLSRVSCVLLLQETRRTAIISYRREFVS